MKRFYLTWDFIDMKILKKVYLKLIIILFMNNKVEELQI